MTRVRNGVTTKARHKKVLKNAKGYFGSKHRLYKTAKEQLMHSGQYAFNDRRQKKSEYRSLWITRINAACRANGMSYSRFIEGLTKAGVEINRKMLAEVAINDMDSFVKMIAIAKDGLEGKVLKQETKKEEVKVVKEEKATKEEKKPAKKAEKKEEATDLSKMTVAELKKLAQERKIEGASTMKKAELLEKLK